MYYASFGILALVIHIIVNFESLRRPKEGANFIVESRYRYFLFGVMIYYISDFLWGFLYDLRIISLVYADTVLYFVSMGLTFFLWMRFSDSFLRRHGNFKIFLSAAGWSVFAFEIIMLIINLFIPMMFGFDASGEYVPGTARYVTLDMQIALFVIVGIVTLIRMFKLHGRDRLHHKAIGISGLIMALFIVLQEIFPLVAFYSIGCLIATSVIHTFVEVDERVLNSQKLGSVKQMAFKDPLTCVRNSNAYAEAKKEYDHQINSGLIDELGVVVFDLNDLKTINDTLGHEAGDNYLKEGCRIICTVFKHSPVFRIGGDEFVAVLKGEDYENREELFRSFNEIIENNLKNGGAIVSAGICTFKQDSDISFDSVFKRADARMYARKKELKSRKAVL